MSTEPFDLDALVNEALGTPFQFTAGGTTFTLADPLALAWEDVEQVQADATAGRFTPALSTLLGDDFPAFRDLRLPSWKLVELFGAWSKHFGVSLGESGASPRRSVNTRRR